MSTITLQTELTPDGIICSNATLGQVATIRRECKTAMWEVYPYGFPPYERLANFKSLQAAEFYALALAYEMHETK
jgi:hypothetical protein